MAYNLGGDEWDDFNWGDTTSTATNQTQEQTDISDTTANTNTSLKSKSNTSMPTWWTNSMQNAWNSDKSNFGSYFQGTKWLDDTYDKYTKNNNNQGTLDSLLGNVQNVWNEYGQMPQKIEKKRQSLVDQIYANLPKMRELYQPTMENMSQRGILNSSITGSALGDIQEGVNRDIASKVAEANTWAADSDIKQQSEKGNYLSNLVNTVLGANTSNQSYYKTLSDMGSNRQQLVNALMELLRGQSSETYNV